MKKLSKSTWLLVGLLITLIALGTVLILTLPEEYTGFFKFHRFTELTSGELSADEELYNYNRPYGIHHRPHIFLLIITGIVIFLIIGAVYGRRHFYMHQRCRSGIAYEILEEQYAEGKISKEELLRKRKIMEE